MSIYRDDTLAPRLYWVKREKRGVWHLAESWIAGDAVTYCGKRMRDGQTADGVLITLALTPRHGTGCKTCSRVSWNFSREEAESWAWEES